MAKDLDQQNLLTYPPATPSSGAGPFLWSNPGVGRLATNCINAAMALEQRTRCLKDAPRILAVPGVSQCRNSSVPH